MVVNLKNIFTKENHFAKVEKGFHIESIRFGGQDVPVMDDILISLTLEEVKKEEVLLQGFVTAKLILSCDRCNEKVSYLLKTKIMKEINLNEIEEDESFMDGCNLDLEKLALNEIYVSFPMKVLCKEDCKSICKECGTNLNLYSCNCKNESIDPRLAGLKDLFNENFKEV